jgi:hypothetical protein
VKRSHLGAAGAVIATQAVLLLGCGTPTQEPVDPPPPVTFSLQNGGATSVYLFEQCILDLGITDLSSSRLIGRAAGCPICDCAQTTCPAIACGACFSGGVEVAATAAREYLWSPVDVSIQPRAGSQCSRTQILPAGQYRIDVPVYPTADDAAAKSNGRLVTRTFELPATETIVIPLVPASS